MTPTLDSLGKQATTGVGEEILPLHPFVQCEELEEKFFSMIACENKVGTFSHGPISLPMFLFINLSPNLFHSCFQNVLCIHRLQEKN